MARFPLYFVLLIVILGITVVVTPSTLAILEVFQPCHQKVDPAQPSPVAYSQSGRKVNQPTYRQNFPLQMYKYKMFGKV